MIKTITTKVTKYFFKQRQKIFFSRKKVFSHFEQWGKS